MKTRIVQRFLNAPDAGRHLADALQGVEGLTAPVKFISDTTKSWLEVQAQFEGDATTLRQVADLLDAYPDHEALPLFPPPAAAPPEPREVVPTVGVTEAECDAAVQVWEDEGRINPLMLAKRTGWPVTRCIISIDEAKAIGKLPKDVKA